MKLRLSDLIVTVISLAAFSVAGLLFYRNMTDQGANPDQPQIGLLSTKEGSAQRKYQGRIVWQEIQALRPVFNLDSIRTDADASATLTLTDGTEIMLGASTLVTLDIPKGGAAGSISFESGSVTAKGIASAGAEGAAGLKIKSRDSVVTLGSGEVSVKAEGGGIRVEVSKGTADLSVAGGAAETVKASQTATVAAGSAETLVEDNVLDFASPAQGSSYLATGATVEVAFSWTSLRELGSYSLEISKKESMKPLAKKLDLKARTAVFKLEPGVYWARVSGKEGTKAIASGLLRLSVVADSRPKALSPKAGATAMYKGSWGSVRFEWSGADKATSYVLEAAKAADFADPLRLDVAGKTATLDGLDEGTWFWRVRPAYAFGGIGAQPPTAPLSFTLTRKKALEATRFLAPAEGDVVPEVAMRKSGILFSWKSDPDATSNRFMLSADPGFGTLLADEALPAASYLSRAVLSPGRYYWKVEARGSDLTAPPAEARSFSVTELTVVVTPTGPAPGAEFERGAVIPFAWKAANDAGGTYKLSVLKASDGSLVSAQELKTRSLPLEAPPPGDYLWKLSFTDEFGVTRYQGAETAFAVLEPLGAAGALSPAPDDGLKLVSVSKLEFKWTEVEGAGEYLFTLKNSAGTPLVEAPKLGKAAYTFTDMAKLKEGAYTWTVRAIQKRGGRERTSVAGASFTLVDVINCPPAGPLASPAVLTPRKGEAVDMSKATALVFKWKPLSGATRYKLSLYGKKEPERVILSMDGLTAPEYRLTDLEKLDVGEFFWILEAETVEKGIKTRSSPALRTDFSITLGGGSLVAPEILSPEVQFGR